MSVEEVVRLTWNGEEWSLELGVAEFDSRGWMSHEDGTVFQPKRAGSYAAKNAPEAIENTRMRLNRQIEEAEARIRSAQEELNQARKLSDALAKQEERLRQSANTVLEAQRLVRTFFEGSRDKTRQWFRSQNPLLGHLSPNELIGLRREEKLLEFIRTQLAENVGPPLANET